MAEDKKKKTNTGERTGKSDRNNKKTQAKKKPSKKEIEQLRMEEEIRRAEMLKKKNQRISIIVFACSLAFLSIVLIPATANTAWHGIRGFVFGLFGYSGFIIPFVALYIALVITLEKYKQNITVKLLEGFALVLCLSALMYVITYPDPSKLSFGADVSAEYLKYFHTDKIGWGILGALLGEAFMYIGMAKAPAIAILIILTFLSFMFMTGFTLIKLATGVSNSAQKVGKKIEKAKKEREERSAAEDDEPDVYVDDDEPDEDEYVPQPKRHKGHFYVYSEDDLLDPATDEGQTETEETEKPESDIKPAEVENDDISDVPIPSEEPKEEDIKDIFAMAEEKQAKEEAEKLSKTEIENAKADVTEEIEQLTQEDEAENYILPPLDCLRLPVKSSYAASQADLRSTADKLIAALNSFNVEATVVDVVPGPSVTRYELAPAPGVKISKFTNLADDLALHLAAPAGVRIEAPIPNKSAIGIEVPNRGRTTVTMREIVDSDIYAKSKSKINVALGKDIAGNVVCADLAKMPHLLIAGTTGSGKSVCLNAMIISLLYNAKPNEVKLLLIDPKQVEFSVYNGIPHLLVPVVSDARKAAGALGWAVTEMLNRYKILNDNGVRDIGAYNKLCDSNTELQKMSQIVIVIDELSDLMSVAPSEVEGSITRLAQMARAAGMHLVVATQRPSVDVITGLIKANIPSRIALSVSSQVDSRTILDASGAEKLLGLGDMLYCPVGMSKPLRVQGCYLSDSEIENVVEFVKTQEATSYDDNIQQEIDKQALSAAPKKGNKDGEAASVSDADAEIIAKAAELVIDNPDKASISSLQRNLSLGFAKAGRIMDALEEKGVVGPHSGSKPRKVLMTKAQWYEMNALSSSDTDNGDETDE